MLVVQIHLQEAMVYHCYLNRRKNILFFKVEKCQARNILTVECIGHFISLHHKRHAQILCFNINSIGSLNKLCMKQCFALV